MTPLRILRALLFLPPGDPVQQNKDVQTVAEDLRQGKEQVRIIRSQIEKAQRIRQVHKELLEKLK